MADNIEERQERLRQVLNLQELYHGRFNQQEIQTLLTQNDWNDGEVISFIQENEAATVRQAIQRLTEDQIKVIQSDPNIARSLADGIATDTRLFACQDCDRSWWRKVPIRKQVSKCHRCLVKYDPVPEEYEWGWAIFNCECGNEFSGHGQKGVGSECYKCGCTAYATEIRPPSRRRNRRTRNRHSCNAPDCDGHAVSATGSQNTGGERVDVIYDRGSGNHDGHAVSVTGSQNTGGERVDVIYDRGSGNHDQAAYNPSGHGDHNGPPAPGRYQPHPNRGTGGDITTRVCASPESRQGKPKVIYPSNRHNSSGSTVATFLDQDDLCSLDSYVTSLPVITEDD